MRKNPQDATLRNTRSAEHKIKELRKEISLIKKFLRTYFPVSWKTFNDKQPK